MPRRNRRPHTSILHVRLPLATKRRLQAAAREDRRSVSAFLRILLDAHLTRAGAPEAASTVRPT